MEWEYLEASREPYYSILPHATTLTIRGNPDALQDLLAYVRGTYQLDGRWERQILENLPIEVDCSAADL